MSGIWEQAIKQELSELAAHRLKRRLEPVAGAAWPVLFKGSKRMLNFSSNNYLGLAGHPALAEAMAKAVEQGAGATASRLIIGHSEETERLEAEIARFKGTEAALVFPSGYMANLGLLSTLLTPRDAVFSDQWNHASIVDGIRLSGARSFRYRHNDLDHLEKLMKRADEKGLKRKLIITDTVFSMDGDVAPLPGLVELKKRYDAALVVDEAHGGGVFGPHGEGMAHQAGVAKDVDLHMGTFSKAFGVYGAYVAGKAEWISYLVNRCRSFIYTTALPPAIIAAIRASLGLVVQADELRKSLIEKSTMFRGQLREWGISVADSTTHIIPLIIGESKRALEFSHKLAERGILAVAIRPPTVPEGTARLRFSLMANQDEKDLRDALSTIRCLADEMGVISRGS